MRVLILGAAGSIGSVIAWMLHKHGNDVVSTFNNLRSDSVVNLPGKIIGGIDACDERLGEHLADHGPFDALIYSVGHCPPGGMEDATSRPLSEITNAEYEYEFRAHQLGALNTFRQTLPLISPRGHMVFITSAITRLKGKLPPQLHAEYHAGIISAEDWLIDGMRKDPAVDAMAIRIHRVAPAAVDTPFHSTGMQPPAKLQIEVVARVVCGTLHEQKCRDWEILP